MWREAQDIAVATLRTTTADHRVTPAELFFDLVFVYAITQVAQLMSNDISARSMVEGTLVLFILWWAWCCFAWLGNVVRADVGALRLTLFAVMALMLVVAITVPESFNDLPGGVDGPVAFVVCYLLVRLLHLSMYWISDPDNRDLHRVLLRSLASLSVFGVLALAGALIGGSAQLPLWSAAFALDFVGIYLTGADGWRIASAAHWAERHALIIIVALGESIVALGVGVAQLPVSWRLIATVVLGVAVVACLWVLYFDGLEQEAEHVLAAREGRRRTALARDAYTYLHLPLMAGIVIAAVGLKKVSGYVADVAGHDLGDRLSGIAAWTVTGGVGIYLLGTAAFALRTTGRVRASRIGTGVALLLGGFLVPYVPALVALLALVVVLIGLVLVEPSAGRRRITSRVRPAGAVGRSPRR